MSEHPPYHHFKNLYCQVQNFLSLGMLLEFWEQIVGAAVKWLPPEMHNPLQNGCFEASHKEVPSQVAFYDEGSCFLIVSPCRQKLVPGIFRINSCSREVEKSQNLPFGF